MMLELRDLGRPGESLGEVVLGFAEALCADIDNIGSDTAARIHDIRVGTKKLRALVRLAGGVIDPDAVDAIAAGLREIRQAFAGSRDEEVMRHRLAELLSGDAPPAIEALGLAAEPSSLAPPTGRPRELATGLRSLLAAVDFSSVTGVLLLRNAARSYRRARKLRDKCQTGSAGDVLMHEWRKRTKDVCYHAIALSASKTMKKLAKPLDALAELLGEYHDLALLGERSASHKRIKAVVDKRKRKVARECFRAAKKVFRRKPFSLKKTLSERIAE